MNTEIQSPQRQVIVIASTKSVGVAVILAAIFGPLGIFYASTRAAIIMMILTFLVLITTAGLGMLLTWPAGMYVAARCVSSHNKRLMKGVAR